MSAVTSATCRQCCAGQRGLQQRQQALAAAAPRRRPSRHAQPAVCLSSLDGGAGAAGLVAQGVAWAAVAYMASQVFFRQQVSFVGAAPTRAVALRLHGTAGYCSRLIRGLSRMGLRRSAAIGRQPRSGPAAGPLTACNTAVQPRILGCPIAERA